MGWAGLLLMIATLAGCAAPPEDASATGTPAPGSITAHMNGRVVVMGGAASVR